MKSAIIIGSGFAGLSAAAFMASYGWKVTVLEKNSGPGGRARQLNAKGFRFDMGPSWYWMPEVYERFFARFGKTPRDFYRLQRLDPSYRIFWPDAITDIPAGLDELKSLFESWQPGAARKLDLFLKEAGFKYKTGMEKMAYQPGLSALEFADRNLLKSVFHMDIFASVKVHVAKYFDDPRIRQLMEFPVLFLGAPAEKTPALYSLMNYADIVGGTWYPDGGMYSVVAAMHQLATQLGVEFRFGEEVVGLTVEGKKINKVVTTKTAYAAEVVVASADYQFVEQTLLAKQHRTYAPTYWESRQMAPSSLLYFVGINKKLRNVRHHNLFFDTDFTEHAREIYSSKSWPAEPLFYLCVNSVTDPLAAPDGCENLFFLIPIATGLTNDNESLHEKYFEMILERFEQKTGEQIRQNIIYKRYYGPSDFINDYHAFKGNAYGLANTLKQTAILKPKCRSSKIKNLYYTGQLTVPGPGVPPSLISGEIVASLANAEHKKISV